MDEQSLRKYAGLMQELGLTGLEFNENGSTVRLERNVTTTHTVPAETVVQTSGQAPAISGLIDISSPMVGIFYSAPTENAPPFVKVGDVVHKGDVLCIIEAMKLMNEIVAEQSGIITEVCVGNRQVVDYGHVLFRMRKEPV